MKHTIVGLMLVGGTLASFAMLGAVRVGAHDDDDRGGRIERGLRISPVPLHIAPGKRARVGMGSYLVNAVGGCNDCHTCPSYAPGHNPYGPPFGPPGGGDGKINGTNFLAGGVVFNPPGVKSANLTPDTTSHLPEEGNTFDQFRHLIRTGHDPEEGNRILQVMPWPVFRNMSDDDLHNIYEYLRAIPHAEPGVCVAPGQ
jgi:hypothetical protein